MNDHSPWPRGLSRTAASRYVGVSATHFDRMVVSGDLPQGKRLGNRVIWDRADLDLHIEALPKSDEVPANKDVDPLLEKWRAS